VGDGGGGGGRGDVQEEEDRGEGEDGAQKRAGGFGGSLELYARLTNSANRIVENGDTTVSKKPVWGVTGLLWVRKGVGI
jgi:hypothetical protein